MNIATTGLKPKDAYDVIVIGAGAGGLACAVVAANEGLETLVLEKTPYVGGTMSYAGGMAWSPNNPKKGEVGADDSIEKAETYLNATAGTGASADLRKAFLDSVEAAIGYLDRHTQVKMTPVPFYPDYYPDAPCSTVNGRIMEPLPFDGRELGRDFTKLRPPLPEFTLFGGMMVSRYDLPHFRNVFKSVRAFARVTRLIAEYAVQRVRHHRGTSLVLGNALAARLLKSLQNLNVPIRLQTTVRALEYDQGRVTGVVIDTADGPLSVKARKGVVLATGGFPHNAEMREKYLPPEASPYSAMAEGNTGDGINLGMHAGGFVPGDDGNDGYWSPVSRFKREDGSYAIYPHTVADRGKPGFFAVNADGRRFTNEANSYHDFVKGMFKPVGNRASTPAWLVCDQASLWKYGLGAVKPMHMGLKTHLKSGYIKKADTLEELAALIGVDAQGLKETAERYNADAAQGIDNAFGRGGNVYHRYMGDPSVTPNPCMAPLEKPPYYAVELFAGTLGTAAGLKTNRTCQVVGKDGQPVPGLYACGNDMNSIMAGTYPGPGITLGPALVFGYVAGMHLADR